LKLSETAVIAPEKITHYLLKWQPDNDKSEFLRRAGYTLANWKRLREDIRIQLKKEAELSRRTLHGDMFKIRGEIIAPKGITLRVVTIWMAEYKSGQTKFITLFPNKEVQK